LKRIIPKLLLKNSTFDPNQMVLVNTKKFDNVKEIGDPVSQSKIYQSQVVDELIFLDLDARKFSRPPNFKIIRNASEEIFMPFCVGGGVNSVYDFSLLLNNGADKVSINTAAFLNPKLIKESADIYGSQCVVVSIDYSLDLNGNYFVYIDGGKTKTSKSPLDWALESEKNGAGEILLTSIDRDGTGHGIDIELTKKIVDSVSIPVITSGGCGLSSHFSDAFLKCNVSGVSAGTFFSMRDQNPIQTRSHIKNAGIKIRTKT
jgi:imidazole glycerol-phosphate synthase subunit HisF